MSTSTVLILGASYAGLAVCHKLARTLPVSTSIIIVSPSTHAYWNIAAPRAVAIESAAFQEKLFEPIVVPERVRFVHGTVTSVTPQQNTATITLHDGKTEDITYSQLVVATGARAADGWPFKAVGSHEATLKAIREMNGRIAAAGTIVLSGAGPTGVETAGEVATYHKGKKIYLISSSEQLLPDAPAKVGTVALKTLTSLGVTVKTGAKVVREDNGQLQLSNGETIQADVHIPTFGLFANSEFLPSDMVDEKGYIKIDAYTRSTVHPNIWAVGDVASGKTHQVSMIGVMTPVTHENVQAVVEGKEPTKVYDSEKVMWAVFAPMGNGFGNGTGHVNGWKVFGWIVWLVKGRDFMVGGFPAIAQGKMSPGFAKV